MAGGVETGRRGERIAAEYLLLRGYRIVGRNVRAGRYEIDLVAFDGDCLVFVEVRTRRSGDFGTAAETASVGKLRRMRKAAREYLAAGGGVSGAGEYRFDLVAIDLDRPGDSMTLEHIRGIF